MSETEKCWRVMRFLTNSWAFSHCKSFTVAVKLLILNLPSNHLFVFLLKRQSSDAPDEDVCDYRELPKSGLCRSATVSISEKSCVWQLVWLVNSGVAARLPRASGQKLIVCRQEGDMAGASPGEEHGLLGEMLSQLRRCRI